jgi:hypothetical protein
VILLLTHLNPQLSTFNDGNVSLVLFDNLSPHLPHRVGYSRLAWACFFLLRIPPTNLQSVADKSLLYSVNIPGLSFRSDTHGDGSVLGGGPTIPSVESLGPWLNLNCTMFRFPVLWNYIQPNFDGELDKGILGALDALINKVTASQKYAILDVVSHKFYFPANLLYQR